RSAASRPRCDLFPGQQVGNCNTSRIGNVDIGSMCASVELKTFWMRPQRDFGDLAARDSIDDCQRTTAVTDDDLLVRLIYAHVVGIAAEVDPAISCIVRSLIKPQRTVAAIGDIERVGGTQVADALRLLQARNHFQGLTLLKVDNADRVIAEFGDKQPVPIGISSHVIDTATNVTERKSGLQL